MSRVGNEARVAKKSAQVEGNHRQLTPLLSLKATQVLRCIVVFSSKPAPCTLHLKKPSDRCSVLSVLSTCCKHNHVESASTVIDLIYASKTSKKNINHTSAISFAKQVTNYPGTKCPSMALSILITSSHPMNLRTVNAWSG